MVRQTMFRVVGIFAKEPPPNALMPTPVLLLRITHLKHLAVQLTTPTAT